jgi:hypothetical protein
VNLALRWRQYFSLACFRSALFEQIADQVAQIVFVLKFNSRTGRLSAGIMPLRSIATIWGTMKRFANLYFRPCMRPDLLDGNVVYCNLGIALNEQSPRAPSVNTSRLMRSVAGHPSTFSQRIYLP